SIPNHSVTLLDKGFFSADLLLSIQNAEQNRHWMIPERKGTVRTEVEHYGDGDYLVQMRVSPQARKKNPALP
ncbi:IS4 family transposase, partial [Pseudomonas syringae]|nr:IS4 family transposase [Pseudomonas syringae]